MIVAHPDDAELGAGGTIVKHVAMGKRVGVIDLTQGELGSRGTVESRKAEATASSKILGLQARDNLAIPDGFFENNKANQLLVIDKIREYQPDVVIANALHDRHIDHGRAAQLVNDAFFLSGLLKIETSFPHYRPKQLLHMVQDRYMTPDFIIDVSAHWGTKMKSIMAYKTQFYDPSSTEPDTPISGKDFINFLEARGREYGRTIGAEFGEGFVAARTIGVEDITSLK